MSLSDASALPPNNIFDSNSVEESSLAKYQIQFKDLEFKEIIGSGAFGEVSDGIYIPKGERVAIKKLHIVPTDGRAKELFKREVENLVKASHQYLLPFVGYTAVDPYCIVTKFIPNDSLFHALHDDVKKTTLNSTDLNVIAYGIATGMQYLHQNEILHRDLKSQNVLLDEKRNPVICDFGSSRKAELAKTMSTTSAGTSNYMAPEFFVGGHYNKEIDVYSFAMVLWEMLTGQIPFNDLEPAQVIYTVAIQKGRPFIGDDTPAPIKTLIERCWAQDPTMRPPFSEISEMFFSGSVEFPGNIRKEFLERIGRSRKKSTNANRQYRSSLSKPLRGNSSPQLKMHSFQSSTAAATTASIMSTSSASSVTPEMGSIMMNSGLINGGNTNFSMTPSCLVDKTGDKVGEKAEIYLKELNINSPNLPTILDFFEAHVDDPSLASVAVWPPFLSLLVDAPPNILPHIQQIAAKFAQNSDIRGGIRKVTALHTYLEPCTIDLFLFFINFESSCVDFAVIEKLISIACRVDRFSEKAVILLYKIMSFHENFQTKITLFFRESVFEFSDRGGGHIILKSLVMSNLVTKEMITAYGVSKVSANAYAAYEATFTVLWVSPECFQLITVLAHVRSNDESLRSAALEFLRRFSDGAAGQPLEQIVNALIFAGLNYGCEEAVLLLCRIASDPERCITILQLASEWFKSRYPIIFYRLYLMLLKHEGRHRIFLWNLDENYTFIYNFLKVGPAGSEIAVSSVINIIPIDATMANKLVKYGISDIICRYFIKYTDQKRIAFVAHALGKIGTFAYCNTFTDVVRFILKLVSKKGVDPKCISKCMETLGVIALFKETHETFREEGAIAIFTNLIQEGGNESLNLVRPILTELQKGRTPPPTSL